MISTCLEDRKKKEIVITNKHACVGFFNIPEEMYLCVQKLYQNVRKRVTVNRKDPRNGCVISLKKLRLRMKAKLKCVLQYNDNLFL